MKLEKVYIDKVWADEIFYASETIENVLVTAPAGVVFSAASTITGEATVAVISCELSETIAGVVTATVEFMVQEDLTVQIGAAPGPDDFPLEYAFRYDSDFTFQKLTLPADIDIENLACQVFRFQGTVEIQNVSLPEGASQGSFDNFVTTMTKLKVTEGIQTFVALGTAPYVRIAPITVTNP